MTKRGRTIRRRCLLAVSAVVIGGLGIHDLLLQLQMIGPDPLVSWPLHDWLLVTATAGLLWWGIGYRLPMVATDSAEIGGMAMLKLVTDKSSADRGGRWAGGFTSPPRSGVDEITARELPVVSDLDAHRARGTATVVAAR